jgi:hypothetical protein
MMVELARKKRERFKPADGGSDSRQESSGDWHLELPRARREFAVKFLMALSVLFLLLQFGGYKVLVVML